MHTSQLSRLSSEGRRLLLDLQSRGIRYFLDNQLDNGLVLDRQRNHGKLRPVEDVWVSTAATGMGLIVLALAARQPYGVITKKEAHRRVLLAVETALGRLPRTKGVAPHFVNSVTLEASGADRVSTIDSSWLIAGVLTAAELLGDSELMRSAKALYDGVDWQYWSRLADGAGRLIIHGAGDNGVPWLTSWDQLNAETAFMYILAIGAQDDSAVSPISWRRLTRLYGTTAGRRFLSAGLGLFTSQYSLEILDPRTLSKAAGVSLSRQAKLAALANHDTCQENAGKYRTYSHFWGLSAGDGPDGYMDYSPERFDGTAHVTASVASISSAPRKALANIRRAVEWRHPLLLGRYGLSNINLDRSWRSDDVVGIDIAMAFMAVDNYLYGSRIRQAFNRLPLVARAMTRLSATRAG